ncbi:AbrB/MazE/SpoVT family DNA-binding domain-containing protein [bacterium]|nr:AbrB/MazE/SpoVT family DNA-binding domain-containing protein [bacterium]
MKTKIVKWGNSLGLRIPKSFAEDVRISEGTTVDLLMEDGQLVVRVAEQARFDLEVLLAGVTEENLHKETDTGESVGGESW